MHQYPFVRGGLNTTNLTAKIFFIIFYRYALKNHKFKIDTSLKKLIVVDLSDVDSIPGNFIEASTGFKNENVDEKLGDLRAFRMLATGLTIES